jgi:hypothetical protein
MQDNSKCTIDLTIQQLTTIVTGYSRQLLANYCDPIFQLCFNLNRIHDSVGKALRTADQDRVTVNSHALSFSFDHQAFILNKP